MSKQTETKTKTLCTLTYAAQLIGRHYDVVARLIEEGWLREYRVGNQSWRYVAVEDVERLRDLVVSLTPGKADKRETRPSLPRHYVEVDQKH